MFDSSATTPWFPLEPFDEAHGEELVGWAGRGEDQGHQVVVDVDVDWILGGRVASVILDGQAVKTVAARCVRLAPDRYVNRHLDTPVLRARPVPLDDEAGPVGGEGCEASAGGIVGRE